MKTTVLLSCLVLCCLTAATTAPFPIQGPEGESLFSFGNLAGFSFLENDRLISWGNSGYVLWDLKSGSPLDYNVQMPYAAIAKNGNVAASAYGTSIKIANGITESLVQKRTIPLSPSYYTMLEVSPRGKYMVMKKNNLGYLVSLDTLEEYSLNFTWNGSNQLYFTNHDTYLITVTSDGKAKVWSLPDKTILFETTTPMNVQYAQDYVAFSESENLLFLSKPATGITEIRTMNGSLLKTIPFAGRMVISPDGMYALFVTQEQTLQLVDLHTDQAVYSFSVNKNYNTLVNRFGFSGDSNRFYWSTNKLFISQNITTHAILNEIPCPNGFYTWFAVNEL